jgi:nucleoside-diphosphate-sugar epimerase
MRILIAGCGYVGSELAGRLRRAGHTVYGLRRDTSRLPAGVQSVAADLGDMSSLRVLPAAIDFVFYTASASDYGESAYRAAYVDGLGNLLTALEGQKPQRVFFTSSTGVYDQNDGEWIDESSPAKADRATSQALRDGERLVLASAFPATVVRFSGIYGPGRTRLIDSVAAGSARLELGDTRYLNHIHRDDCAGVLAHLMGRVNPAELYVATDNEPKPRNELLRWIADTLGRPSPPFADEERDQKATSERGGNRRYKNERLCESGYFFKYPTFREGYGALITAGYGARES